MSSPDRGGACTRTGLTAIELDAIQKKNMSGRLKEPKDKVVTAKGLISDSSPLCQLGKKRRFEKLDT